MNIGRRKLLQGFAATGLSATLGSSSTIAAPAKATVAAPPYAGPRPFSVVLPGTEIDELLLAGARNAMATLALPPPTRLTCEAAQLAATRGVLLAITDDASAAILIALARAASARLTWFSHHRLIAGATTHHVEITTTARGSQITQILRGNGIACNVVRRDSGLCLHAEARGTTAPSVEAWAWQVGAALAQVAADGAAPVEANDPPTPATHTLSPANHSLVSLILEFSAQG